MPIEYVTGRINVLLDKPHSYVSSRKNYVSRARYLPFVRVVGNDELRPSPTEESHAAPPGPAVVRAGRRRGRNGSSPCRVAGGVSSSRRRRDLAIPVARHLPARCERLVVPS